MGGIIGIDADDDNIRVSILKSNNEEIENLTLALEQEFPNHIKYELQLGNKHFLNYSIFADEYNKILRSKSANLEKAMKYVIKKTNNNHEIILNQVSGYGIQLYLKETIIYLKSYGFKNIVFKKTHQFYSIISALKYVFLFGQAFNFIKFPLIQEFYLMNQINAGSLKFPLMIINVKSGVSFYKLNSIQEINEQQVKRIGGSIIGQSAFGGLAKILTPCKTSVEAQEQFDHGNNRNVDMLVEDIYGQGSAQKLGLPEYILASSFGKAQIQNNFSNQDMVKSLLISFAINLSHISSLYAQLENIQTAIFISSQLISLEFLLMVQGAISFYSDQKLVIYFIEQQEFLGSIGHIINK